jgi:predicted transcriptional regulator
MLRKEEAETLVRQGFTPSEIALKMLVSVATVVQYLRLRVGEGALRLSDIYYFLPEKKRQVVELLIKRQNGQGDSDTPTEIAFLLTGDDISFYKSLRTRSTFAGDLYEHISEAEISVHDLVWKTLRVHFGEDERILAPGRSRNHSYQVSSASRS